jgi:hypothetical protein
MCSGALLHKDCHVVLFDKLCSDVGNERNTHLASTGLSRHTNG